MTTTLLQLRIQHIGSRATWVSLCVLALSSFNATAQSDRRPNLELADSLTIEPRSATTHVAPPTVGPLIALGMGDSVSMQVYGRPELNVTTYVADDGSLPIPLAGNVQVTGLSPAQAAHAIAAAFRQGGYLLDPQITVLLVSSRSQQVSVLGSVRTPGRYVIDSRTSALDVLAQAGGTTEAGADRVVVLRTDQDGKLSRYIVDLKGLGRNNVSLPTLMLKAGDSLFVPIADQFYIYGEVHTPNMYRLEPGMSVVQAITRGGGITSRGSNSRIEIKRTRLDGTSSTVDARLNDPVQVNDVILVKERIF